LILFALLYGGKPAAAQDLVLPPLTLSPAESGRLSSAVRVFVREIRFQGNTVFTDQQLARITAPYLNREASSEELEEARRAITTLYVAHGYMNSGAILPDQDVADGVITFQIVEGVLSDITISGKGRHLRDSYLKGRLQHWAGRPLNLNDLKDGLLLLRQNPNVTQVNAELRPGTKAGESDLDVYLQEDVPYRLGIQIDNQRPPSVGAEEITTFGADYDVTGNNDLLEFSYGIAHNGTDGFEFSGAKDEAGSYTIPFTVWDTTLKVFGNRSDTSVIEDPFSLLHIHDDLIRYGATLRQPVYRTANQELALALTFTRTHNDTSILGQPFDVSGSVSGKVSTSVLQFSQEWVDRSQKQVLALRSAFNFGIDAFGVTDNGTDQNAKFFSWLGQFQYVRRLFDTPNLIILRTDMQWTDEPLLSTEQFSVGGANSVRGYRENQLVGDRAIVASVEGRVPIAFDKTGAGIFQVAPFFDFGQAAIVDGGIPGPNTIASSGIGLLYNPNRHLNAQLYWGGRIVHVPNPHDNLQDVGIHFKVSFEAF
jgi:hemolysin activation/secretion protein